jgi:hypothetical protein
MMKGYTMMIYSRGRKALSVLKFGGVVSDFLKDGTVTCHKSDLV